MLHFRSMVLTRGTLSKARSSGLELIALCVLVLTGCQQATTVAPVASQAELEREQQAQAEFARKHGAQPSESITIDRAKAQQKLARVAKKVVPASEALCREMFATSRPCSFTIELAEKGGLNAYADGQKVVMFPEMIAFTQNDEELALVLAHELAHNMMRHPASQQQNVALGGVLGILADRLAESQGINTGGMLSKFGAQGAVLRYTPGFEREADYTGLYILARSGYDISDVPTFWRRMSAQNPDGIYVGTTHPTNPNRYITLAKTIDEIQAKKQSGRALLPELRPES